MLSVILCVMVSATLGAIKKPSKIKGQAARGACDQTLECGQRDFTGNDGAVCSGYFGCFKAMFETSKNANCIGSASCYKAKFTGSSNSVRCLGYRACEAAKNLEAKNAVTCAGAFACQRNKQITAPEIKCDGDAACSNYNFGNTPELKSIELNAEDSVQCNGKAVCQNNKIKGTKTVFCDGDGACRQAVIEAGKVACHGKRVCQETKILTKKLQAYGFFGAAAAKLKYPMDLLHEDLNAETTEPQLTIDAYGFNSLVGSQVFTRGAYTKISGLGYRSLHAADIYCESAKCEIVCANSACKSTIIYYNDESEITTVPEQCDLQNTKRKAQGIHCPTFTFSKIAGPAQVARPRTGELLEEYEMAMAELDEFNQIEDEALQQYFSEIVDPTSTMDNLEEFDLEDIEQVEMVQGAQDSLLFGSSPGAVAPGTSAMTNTFSSLMVSNFITAGLVVMLFVAATCYSNHCMVNKDEIKKLNAGGYQSYN